MNLYEDNLKNLIEENITEPSALSGVEERFEKRFGKERRKKRIKISSAVTSLLLIFMFITANTNTAWAESLRKIPVLKDFLSAMSFLTPYENDLDELGLLSESGDYQMYLQYALSDDKNIRFYFETSENIHLDDYDRLKIEHFKVYDLKTKEDYGPYFYLGEAVTSGNFNDHYFSLMGMLPPGSDVSFPEELGIEFSAVILRGEAGTKEYYKVIGTEALGEFSFELKLENMIERPRNDINVSLDLLGNNLIVKSLETSSLSTILLFEEEPDNKDRIVSIRGKVLDAETGKVIRDNLDYQVFSKAHPQYGIFLDLSRLSSQPGRLELVIDGVKLLDKEEEYITFTPAEKTVDKSMTNIELTTYSTGYKTLLGFKVNIEDPEGFEGIFHYEYETGSGEKKRMPMGSFQNLGEYRNISYIFEEDINDTIILRRSGSEMPIHKLEQPIRIPIDVPEEFEPVP